MSESWTIDRVLNIGMFENWTTRIHLLSILFYLFKFCHTIFGSKKYWFLIHLVSSNRWCHKTLDMFYWKVELWALFSNLIKYFNKLQYLKKQEDFPGPSLQVIFKSSFDFAIEFTKNSDFLGDQLLSQGQSQVVSLYSSNIFCYAVVES